MRLRVFQANDGDCLLLSSGNDRHMLVDGGRSGSFLKHTAKVLSELGSLDIACVSHIDADHITGILKMLEVEVDWRIHLHEKENPPEGRSAKRKPSVPRPPKIGEIWHNGFGDQLSDSAGDVRSMLSLTANAQLSMADADMMPRNDYLADLALGEVQAMELSHRISQEQLDIPLNKHFDGKLIMAGTDKSDYQLGETSLSVLGPFHADLVALRKQWREWIEEKETDIRDLQKEMDRDANQFGSTNSGAFVNNMQRLRFSAGEFGERSSVSTPNLASIMLLAKEAGKTILLTGDGSSVDILKGLIKVGQLEEGESCHLDVVKFPHHGAIANVDDDFTKSVIADHYVFCGNGSHSNPELAVVNLVADSRFGSASKRSKHANTGDKFHLHFNCTPELAGTEKRTKHMIELQERVSKLVEESEGQMEATFHSKSFFDIEA